VVSIEAEAVFPCQNALRRCQNHSPSFCKYTYFCGETKCNLFKKRPSLYLFLFTVTCINYRAVYALKVAAEGWREKGLRGWTENTCSNVCSLLTNRYYSNCQLGAPLDATQNAASAIASREPIKSIVGVENNWTEKPARGDKSGRERKEN